MLAEAGEAGKQGRAELALQSTQIVGRPEEEVAQATHEGQRAASGGAGQRTLAPLSAGGFDLGCSCKRGLGRADLVARVGFRCGSWGTEAMEGSWL